MMLGAMVMDCVNQISPIVWRIIDVNVCLYLAMGFSYPVSDLLIAGLRKPVAVDVAVKTTQPDDAAVQGRNGWRFADWEASA